MRKAIERDGIFYKAYKKLNIKEMNLPARSSLFFTLTNLLCKGAAFLFTPVFTRLLTPADYGEFSLFSTLLSLSAVASTMEISGGIIMRLFQKERNSHFLSLLSAWLISVSTALPVTLILWIIKRAGGFGTSFPLSYVFLFISLTSISIINLYTARCKFLYKWVPPLITSLLQSVAAPIVGIVLLSVGRLSGINHVTLKIGAVTSVLALTALGISLISLMRAKSEAKSQEMHLGGTLRYIRKAIAFLLRMALPLLPYHLSIMAISGMDKLFISSFLGKSELAKYSVAYSAGVALSALTGGVMGALSPWLMRKVRAGEYKKIRTTLDSIISAAVPLILIFLCVCPELFSFLAPKEYQNALPVLFISAMIPIPLALAQCSSSIAIAREKVGGVLFSGIIPAILTATLDFLIIKQAPLYAPAIITATGFLLLSALGIVNIRKITGKFTINVNKAFQNLLFLTTVATAIFVFKNTIAVRISIAILSALCLALMAKPLISLLGEKNLQ